MNNHDLTAALNYHQRTKHSLWSVQTSRHYLDWNNQPRPFKIYSTIPPLPLPRETTPLRMSALEAIAAHGAQPAGAHIPDWHALARIFFLANGVHRVRKHDGLEFYFRTASCTGALYHIELYLVCGDLPGPSAGFIPAPPEAGARGVPCRSASRCGAQGAPHGRAARRGHGQALSAGVYHYDAHDHALRPLREGDYRDAIVRATAHEPAMVRAPAIIIATDTFWRNAWKYQARAYRHTGWDNGVILANLLASAAALDLPAQVVEGFVDADINQLLGLNTEKEVVVSLVALGRAENSFAVQPVRALASLDLPTAPLSRSEVDYPLIREVHAASALAEGEVAAWRGAPTRQPAAARARKLFPLAPLPEHELPRDALDAVILRRGSTRQFAQVPITFAQLSTMLMASSHGVPGDFLQPFGATLNEWYLIVNAVEGLPSGSYVYHRETQALEPLRAGNFRDHAGYLALDQALGRDASVNIYYLADLESILERFGNRGYRAVQLEAGILGGKIYLAAYALGLGATGLTFFDDDVTAFFSPHAAGKSVIFLMAVGQPLKRKRRNA